MSLNIIPPKCEVLNDYTREKRRGQSLSFRQAPAMFDKGWGCLKYLVIHGPRTKMKNSTAQKLAVRMEHSNCLGQLSRGQNSSLLLEDS